MSSLSLTQKESLPAQKFQSYQTTKQKSCIYRPLELKIRGEQNMDEPLNEKEPPVLTQDESDKVLNYKRQKQAITFNLKECEVTLDGIKHGLLDTKKEIETIRLAQEKVIAQISSCSSREKLIELNEEQLQLHRRLIILVDTEDKLMTNLESQRRALAEARIKDQTFTLDMEDKIDSIYKLYEEREKFNYKRRLEKDQTIKKKAGLIRSKALKSWAKSIQNKAAQQNKDSEEMTPKQIKKKPMNEKIQQFMKTSAMKKNTDKLLADADRVMKQSRRYSNLITLRNRIYDQKDVLWAEAKLREKKAQRKKDEEERVKRELIAAGENPYMHEKIIKLSEKQRMVERRALDIEAQAIKKISEEFENEERQKQKKERSRMKWKKYWDNLARQKRKKLWEKNREFFLTSGKGLTTTTDFSRKGNNVVSVASTDSGAYNFDLLMFEREKSAYNPPPVPPNTVVPETEATNDHPEIKTRTKSRKLGTGRRRKTMAHTGSITPTIKQDHSNERTSKNKEKEDKSQRNRRKTSQTPTSGQEVTEIVKTDPQDSISSERQVTPSEINSDEIKQIEKSTVVVESVFHIKKLESIASKIEVSGKENLGAGEPFIMPVKTYLDRKDKGKLPDVPAFRWSPETVTFKDFVVGKTYRKKVTVTNLSLQIVKFYFKGLIHTDFIPPTISMASMPRRLTFLDRPPPDENTKIYKINDLVQVDFKIPKPLSPGLSHSFTVIFKPETMGDWRGKLNFETPYEAFSIPVQCLKSRLVPTLTPSIVNFRQVVVDTRTSMTVKLQNVGVKSGRISRVLKTQDTTESQQSLMSEWLRDSVSSLMSTRSSRLDNNKAPSRPTTPVAATRMTSKSLSAPGVPLRKSIKQFIEDIITLVTDSTFVVYIQENQRKLEAGEYVHLNIHFHPFHVGTFFTTYEIQFDDPEVEMVQLEIEGTGLENPIKAEPQHVNLKICKLDFHYQQVIKITNDSKDPVKITHYILPALRHFVYVYPKEIRIFPTHSAQFSVKFHPNVNVLTQPGMDEFFDIETLIMDFPVYFESHSPLITPGPLECTFQTVLTETALVVNPTYIDFGTCMTSETVRGTVSISNLSFVAQHIGFVEIPEHITVQPNSGFGTILPIETRDWDILVSVTNDLEGEHIYQLKVQSLERVQQMITIKFTAKSHPISLTHSRIYFPVTCCGSISSAIIEIFSTAAPIRTRGHHTSLTGLMNKFEFLVDEHIPIEIKPRIGYLEPGKSVKLLVNFTAGVTDDEVKKYYIELQKREHEIEHNNLLREIEGITESLAALEEEEKGEGEGEEFNKVKSDSIKSINSDREGHSPPHKKGDNHSKLKIRRKSKSNAQALPRHGSGSGKHRNSLKLGSTGTLEKVHLGETTDEEEFPTHSRVHLKRRQAKLQKLLEQQGHEFIPPDLAKISMNSLEVIKAKRELMHTMTPRSQGYTIPCLVTDPTGTQNTIFLNLKCPIQKPDLILLDDGPTIINFNTVAARSKTMKEVLLYNVSSGNLTLKMDIINPYGAFQRVNALRKIAPDQVFTLKLKFQPKVEGYYEERVTIIGGESQIVLLLTGFGTPPKFNLTPNKPDIYIGTIKTRSLVRHKFEIENEGDVDLEFEIEGGESGNFDGPDFPSILVSEPSHIAVHTVGPHPHPHTGGIIASKVASPRGSLIPVAPPPTAIGKKGDHGKTLRRLSKESRKSGMGEIDTKRKRRKSSHSHSRGSVSSHHRNSRGRLPSLYDFPFEVQEGTTTKHLHFDELISFMEKEKQEAYFGVYPSIVKVAGQKKESFEIGFVPNIPGRYFRTFIVKLFGEPVHTFSVVGIGFEKEESKSHAD